MPGTLTTNGLTRRRPMAQGVSIRHWEPEQPGRREQPGQPEPEPGEPHQRERPNRRNHHCKPGQHRCNRSNDERGACDRGNHSSCPSHCRQRRPHNHCNDRGNEHGADDDHGNRSKQPRHHNPKHHHKKHHHNHSWRLPSFRRPTGRFRRPRKKSRCPKLTCDSSKNPPTRYRNVRVRKKHNCRPTFFLQL